MEETRGRLGRITIDAKLGGECKQNDTEHCVFRFFDLPRELRDAIYDHLTTDKRSLYVGKQYARLKKNRQDAEKELKARVLDAPITSLLFVNHQFYQEYLEQVLTKMTLVLKDHIDYRFSAPRLRGTLKRVRKVACILILYTCDCLGMHEQSAFCKADIDAGKHRTLIKEVNTQLTDPRCSVGIRFYLQFDPITKTEGCILPRNKKLQEELRTLTDETKRLTRLEVYRYSSWIDPALKPKKQDRCVAWARTDGFLEIQMKARERSSDLTYPQ